MPEDFRLIIDLVAVLSAAAIGGLLASWLRQPVLLGYLAAGIIIGPTGLGLIKELVQVETLAQFGVAFLLFTLGVEFSFSELRKVQAISLGGGALQILLTLLVTTLVSLGMGWVTSPVQGVFLGAILSLSSTAVVLRCLMDRNETESVHGQVMLGILVVQDIALGLMLAVLPALDQPTEQLGIALAWALLRFLGFSALAVAASIWVIPHWLRILARTESRELFLLGVVTLCLGIAVLTQQLGLSIEVGAFVAGLMISEVEYADQTLAYVEPLRDIFATLFFAAIGMLIDPIFLWNNLELILGLVALVLVGKFLIVTPLVRVFKYSLKTALITGIGLAQIGEFSFVLASEGQSLGLVSRQVYLLILGTTAVTLVITPFLLRLMPQLVSWAETVPWFKPYLTQSDVPLEIADDLPEKGHVVVCGYGRMGRNIVQLFRDRNLPVTVIEQSEQVIQQLRDQGIPYVYGNAASLPVLEKAGIESAQGMAIALPDPMTIRLCLKRCLQLSPDLDVVVRANQDKDIEVLYQLGAREVVQPEFEASLELATHLLTGMGFPMMTIQHDVQSIRNSHYLDFRPEQPPAQVAQDLRSFVQELNSRWYPLTSSSPLVEMTLEEANLRRMTGVSLMAIQRATGEEIDYPDAHTQLLSGDRLLVVGTGDELAVFDQLARSQVTVPRDGHACQWLMILGDSPVVGKTLESLDLRQYGVHIQAIWRAHCLMNFPDSNAGLQANDRVLLCGGTQSLQRIQHYFSPLLIPLPTVQVSPVRVPVNEI